MVMVQNKQPKTKYPNKRWYLLFVRGDGKTVPIRYFKGVVWAVGGLLCALLGVIGVFLFYCNGLLEQKATLENTIASHHHEMADSRRTADRLLAQLAIAESKLKINRAQTETTESETAVVSEVTPAVEPALPETETATAEAEKASTEADEKAFSEKISTEPAVVSVDNLLACYRPETRTIQVEFKVINVGKKKQPVSGYVFIVLKDNRETMDRWRVYPETKLVNGVPASKKGMRFRIYNYRTMKLAVAHDDPDQVAYATVFVYQQDSGELLLQRDLGINGIPMCP